MTNDPKSNQEHDLDTLEGAMALVRDVQKTARETFARDGSHIPLAIVLARRDAQNGEVYERTSAVALGGFVGMNSHQISIALRAAARRFDAVGLVLVQECWSLSPDDGGVTVAEVAAHLASGRPVREHPAARDALMVTFEHRALATSTTMWTATVAPGTPRVLGEWRETSGGVKGRLTGILPAADRGAT